MAKNKKGFILYADLYETVKELSNNDAGELLKHILEYVNDLDPETENQTVKLVSIPIKQQLKRDLKHWESVRKKRSEAGKASAEKRKQMSTSVKSVQQCSTKSTVIVTDTVNDILKEIDKEKETILNDWLEYRVEIKKPINNHSTLKALIQKLNSKSLDCCKFTINNSIENRWVGLFWDKYVDEPKEDKLTDYIKQQIQNHDTREGK